MSRWMKLGLAALLLQASPTAAQYIGIFMDPSATSCAADVGANPWIDLHVVAVLEGAVTELAGAQFKITGAPTGWTDRNALWVPDVGTDGNYGHPLFGNPPGAGVIFDSCRSDRVPLGRVVVLGAPTGGNVHLRIEGSALYSPTMDCPFVLSCGFRRDKICVGGGEIVLNGPGPASCGPTAVEPSTWTRVKSLYGD